MDIASNALSLATALIDFPATGALVNGAQEVYRWVERERLDRNIFELCCGIARSLAFPNHEGSEIQRQIEHSDELIRRQVRRTPLKIVTSGCLGRLIGRDVQLQWMATTVATLVKFEEPEYATDFICAMMLIQRGRKDLEKYHHEQVPLKAVIAHIVKSIFLNYTNSGYSLKDLPDNLSCLADGILDSKSLANIIATIQKTDGNCVIRSDHFLSSLTLWLYYHFDGRLEVVVGNEILLDVKLGERHRKVSLLVAKKYLRTATQPSDPRNGKVEVSISSGRTPFARATYQSFSEPRLQSYQRQKLYEFHRHRNDNCTGFLGLRPEYPSALLSKATLHRIKHYARTILGWMFRLQVAPVTESRLLLFDVRLPGSRPLSNNPYRALGTLFRRVPRISQNDTGESLDYKAVFQPMPDRDGSLDSEVLQSRSLGYAFIAEHFPLVQDLLRHTKAECVCPSCDNQEECDGSADSDSDYDEFQDGCLQTGAMEYLLLLLAHGLGDAMGTDSVSGQYDYHDVVDGMILVFQRLLGSKNLEWDPVFQVVACLTLGVPRSQMQSEGSEQYSAWCAAQAGSLLVVASWLSLENEPGSSKLFAVDIVEGVIKEVPDDIGMLRCEAMHINDTDLDGKHIKDEDLPNEVLSDWSACDVSDSANYTIESPVFRVFDGTYRLMTAVRSGTVFRMIDPALAKMGYLNALQPRYRTQCKMQATTDHLPFNRHVEISEFDKAIAEWISHSKKATIEVSRTLESPVQLSTLLSLSLDGCVIRDVDRCCTQCALDSLKRYGPRECWRMLNIRRSRAKRVRLLVSAD